eukprot:COSAG01_NODE_60534_length_294_cov_0.800000_1_plen_39_part_01
MAGVQQQQARKVRLLPLHLCTPALRIHHGGALLSVERGD